MYWRITMAFKRLSAVVTIKNGRVVKSYGYGFWRPAGRLQSVLRNLDRWRADEIIILDVSGASHPDPAIVREIKSSKIATPLTYGGGLRDVQHLMMLLEAGCERFVVESLIFQNSAKISEFAKIVGEQALIACLPLTIDSGSCHVDRSYAQRWNVPDLNLTAQSLCKRYSTLPVAEVLAIDMLAEGHSGSFTLANAHQRHPLTGLNKGIIWFGGLNADQAASVLKLPETIAVGFGHVNLERELAIGTTRRHIFKCEGNSHIRRTYGA
jgi:imidazole glycerol-phosphate synthase subunit HisF